MATSSRVPARTSPSSSTRARSPAGPGPAWSIASSGASPPSRRWTSGPTAWPPRASTPSAAAGSLRFADFEGLGHELIVDTSGDAPLIADHPEIPREVALQGFEGVRAYSGAPDGTTAVLEQLMGARRRDDGAYELRGDKRGGWIALDEPPAERGRQSAGTVHHVAWGTTDAEQGEWLDRLDEARMPNSGVIDRHYFHSLYFREPGGVLFELATEEPGFTVDGPVEELGRRIILPPWLESRREQVEARLTPLPDPRADWPVTAK